MKPIKKIDRSTVFLFVHLVALTLAVKTTAQDKRKKYFVIGYVAARGIINTDVIKASKLTHINYAFVGVTGSAARLNNEAADTVNFRKLNLLKRVNPDLKILISIGGGGTGSKYFSDANLTQTLRSGFVASAVEIVRRYELDGIDVDWEYPAVPASFWGNVYRSVDKQNFTLALQEFRKQLDVLEQNTGKKMLLTAAVGVETRHLKNMEIEKFPQYLDFINLMTYDFVGDSVARHHTNLYPSGFINENSVDRAVNFFLAAGVPANKLIVGAAFYAHIYNMASAKGTGLGQKIVSTARTSSGYSFIKDSLVNQKGYKRYWDETAMAPYLFNKKNKQFWSYDDEESIRLKCDYVQSHNLGGIMFWQYLADPKGYLLNSINLH